MAARQHGLRVNWSPQMARLFGAAVKSAALSAGADRVRGEFVVSARGIEGGGIYAVSRAMRDGAALALDLMPDLDAGRGRGPAGPDEAGRDHREPAAQAGAGAGRRWRW